MTVLAIALALLRRVLPQNGKTFLELRKIGNWGALREALEDWLSGRQRGNYYKPLGAGDGQFPRNSSGYSGGGSRTTGENGEKSGERYSGYQLKCFNCGVAGHRSTECPNKSSSGNSGRAGQGSYTPRSLMCFNCGKMGHRSVDCSQKKVGPAVKEVPVGKVSKIVMGVQKGNVAWGCVNGVRSKVLIDSGAEVGVVPRSLVTSDNVECGKVHIADVHGRTSVHESTVVNYELGGIKFSKLAVIEERVGEDVMCIVPFDVLNSEEVEAFRRALSETKGSSDVAADVKVVTRSQARELAELERCENDIQVEDLWSTVAPEGVEPLESESGQGPSSQPDPLRVAAHSNAHRL